MRGSIITSGSGFLGSIFELDAGNILSAPSYASQTWDNLTVAPNDGSLQTAYNFQLGATQNIEASDPVLQGAPGDTSSSTYYEGDGNQYMRLKGANTTFINSLHKNNAIFTWYGFMRPGTVVTNTTLFSTIAPSVTQSGTGSLSNIGINIGLDFTGNIRLMQGNGTTAYLIANNATFPIAPGTVCFIAVSYDESTGSGLFYYNAASGKVTQTFTQAYTSPSAAACTDYPIMLAGTGSNATNTGVRTYRTGLSNLALTETLLDSVYSQYKSRIGL